MADGSWMFPSGRIANNLNGFKFGKYLEDLVGEAPADMVRAHAHHILYKTGLGAAQEGLVAEGQLLLRSYGIDPIFGREVLGWAPNAAGQHTLENLENVVNTLKAVHEAGGSKDDIIQALQELGQKAAGL